MTAGPPEPRNRPLLGGRSALRMVDLQHHCCARDGGTFTEDPERWPEVRQEAYFGQLEGETLPNAAALAEACRRRGIEAIYCVIEALTRDGRDRGLDHRLSNILVPKESVEAKTVEAVAPAEDEIVLLKTASDVFTDQCVESAVRDAADPGYRVTLVGDACCGSSPEAHAHTLTAMRSYARAAATAEILSELQRPEGL